MSWLVNFYKSTIGMKVAMAASGIILVGFVIIHMIGNLQVFLGPEVLNAYGASLKSNAGILWGVRGLLLACIGLHMYSAVILTLRSRAARPSRYVKVEPQAATFASRTMVYGGFILVLYIVYHLMHFTVGNAHPSFREGDVYANVIAGFSSLPVVLVYVAANLTLGVHLFHGVLSLTRTLGLHNPRYARLARAAAVLIAGAVAGGNVIMPLAVYFRIGIAA